MTITTRWFPSYSKPIRIGLYQTMTEDGKVLWRYWTGSRWGWGYENKLWAVSWRNVDGGTQSEKWRGLRSKPKRAAKR